MRIGCAILLATVLSACATTDRARVEHHEARAQALERAGHYDAALGEREEADVARTAASAQVPDDAVPPLLTPFRQ
jgi:hypothetical protein